MKDSEKISEMIYTLIEAKFRKRYKKIKYKFLFKYINNFYGKSKNQYSDNKIEHDRNFSFV